MQAGSSKILNNFYALASRSLQLQFHTSACALKGGARPKSKKSFKGNGAPRLARSPARKRLVSSLKPEGKGATYEVARERARSRDNGPQRDKGPQRVKEPQRDRESLRGRSHDSGPQRDQGSQRFKEPQRDRESLRGSEPRRDRESPRGREPQQDRKSYRDNEPQQDRKSYRDKEPQRDKEFRRDRDTRRDGEPKRDRDHRTDKVPQRDRNIQRHSSSHEDRVSARGDLQGGAPAERRQSPTMRREERKFEREDAPHRGRVPIEELRRRAGPRRRGVDFGLRGESRRPRFKPERDDKGTSWEHRSRGEDAYASRPREDDSRGERGYASRPERPRASKASTSSPLPDEFDTPEIEPLKTLPSRFSSPPLMDSLLKSVYDVLGPSARPSPIQSLALKHMFTPPAHIPPAQSVEDDSSGRSVVPSLSPTVWSQNLLAAETGSGKSIAYLLPMLQHLKLTEHSPPPLNPPPLNPPPPPAPRLPLNPRGLILAPTHELSRQLAAFAKALLHHTRLRVLCASRANNASSSRGKKSTARQMKRELDDTSFGMTGVGSVGLHGNRPVDVLVGTTSNVLEMVRGLGWDRSARIEEEWDEDRKERARRWVPGMPEMGLASIEWVVVDEADVLFDRDFETSTRLLLADIARARGYTHPSFAALESAPRTQAPAPSAPLAYPFHLTLTSATIPASLASYLSIAHPKMARLASPRLHRLPTTLSTEHHDLTSGNKNSDIEKRLRRVWADDAQGPTKTRSKVLVFCNKSTKVEDLGLYLKEKGIPNVALTSSGDTRGRGSNRHLAGFLKTAEDTARLGSPSSQSTPSHPPAATDPRAPPTAAGTPTTGLPASTPTDPHVLITTSLLSRGLDFSPQIQHVFLVDSPRNMVDFLHRAGRAGRAGNAGRVVLFGKPKGRGSGEARDVRRRVGAVTH